MNSTDEELQQQRYETERQLRHRALTAAPVEPPKSIYDVDAIVAHVNRFYMTILPSGNGGVGDLTQLYTDALLRSLS